MTLARDHTVADGARYLASWTAAMFHTTDVAEGLQHFPGETADELRGPATQATELIMIVTDPTSDPETYQLHSGHTRIPLGPIR
ncbi:MAG TPA: hypothetical protein VGH89_16925 [Pseudonocardia sp.]